MLFVFDGQGDVWHFDHVDVVMSFVCVLVGLGVRLWLLKRLLVGKLRLDRVLHVNEVNDVTDVNEMDWIRIKEALGFVSLKSILTPLGDVVLNFKFCPKNYLPNLWKVINVY